MTKYSKHLKDISSIDLNSQIKSVIEWASNTENEINQILEDYDLSIETKSITKDNPHDYIKKVFFRFPQFINQLQYRREGRATLNINDEYDVQDVLSYIFQLFFEDIRTEEHAPSYAGVNPRIDILLKKEQIVIEVKKTRSNLTLTDLRSALIVDKAQYQTHPDCKFLYFFIYDPEKRIKNPRGFERDLSDKAYGYETKAIIIS